MRKQRAVASSTLLASVLVICVCQFAKSQDEYRSNPRYTITDLGVFPGREATVASDINNQGLIIGHASDPGEENAVALVWDAGKPTRLPGLPGYRDTMAVALNEGGQVVGSIRKNVAGLAYLYGCLWSERSPRVLGSFGGQFGTATDINTSGTVVGWADTNKQVAHAWQWSGGKLTLLPAVAHKPHSNATSINNSGQIVGLASDTSDTPVTRAILWEQNKSTELGTLGGKHSFASSINDRGDITGDAATMTGDTHAFLWQRSKMTDLGTLGGENSQARDLNNQGQVVGAADTKLLKKIGSATLPVQHAFLWEEGKMLDLSAMIPESSGWELLEARGINDRGQIVGWGQLRGKQRAFLLTPINPSSIPGR